MGTKTATDGKAQRPGNLAGEIGWGGRLRRLGLAAGAGALLAAAYAPCAWWGLAWVALAPLLALGVERARGQFALGYSFGLGYFLLSFGWLREVFLLAPLGVALICALFPACWLGGAAIFFRVLVRPASAELRPRWGAGPPPAARLGPAAQVLLSLLLAAWWVALEWMRSWFLSGFPWNLLGVSQWQQGWLLPLCRFTGVYGLSFLLVTANVAIFLAARDFWLCRRGPSGGRSWRPWGLAVPLLLLLPVAASHLAYRLPEPQARFTAGVCQGNIPQIRVYRPEQLREALEAYLALTDRVLAQGPPDLLVWPETALPAPLTVCREEWPAAFARIRLPWLVGSVETRPVPGAVKEQPDATQDFNTALFFDAQGRIAGSYDKIHIVPFGEYVPGERYLPWLVDWIGMGRSLTPGREFTIFPFLRGARLGVNICYEDIFPEISRGLVQRGANVLVTLTNDAWYNETAGSRQHLAHCVFRAVENARPLLRNGNNADSCLIWPDGRLEGRLVDPQTGAAFARTAGIFQVPVWTQPPLTFYARHGDVFAVACVLLAGLALGWAFYRHAQRCRKLHDLVAPPPVP